MCERVAMLVVHGIGEEQPYGTLDQFTRGLLKELDPCNQWVIEPIMSQEPDPTRPGHTYSRVAYKLVPPSPVHFVSDKVWSHRMEEAAAPRVETRQFSDITLFEYYWSPITKNRIKYTTSLLFLIEAGLQPFRYLASNITAITTAHLPAGHRHPEPADSPLRIFAREVLRQTLFFLPLLLLFVWLVVALEKISSVSLKSLNVTLSVPFVVTAILVAIRYLYLYTNARALMRPPWRVASLAGMRWLKPWLIAGVLFHLFFWSFLLRPVLHFIAYLGFRAANPCLGLGWLAVTASAVQRYADGYLGTLTAGSLWDKIVTFVLLCANPDLSKYAIYAVGLALAWLVRHILINYVGDVAVYANPDQLSENYAARAQVLEGCTTALADILKQTDAQGNPSFDRVLVAGHSLGSVIAYDSLNSLLNLARTGQRITAADLSRLRGLITFGSPLNKIYYFFRELDDPEATLRHRTLDLLHAFRLKPSLATNLPPLFAPVPHWQPFLDELRDNFTWINAYSLADPISGRLLFYDVGREDPNSPGRFVIEGAQERFKCGFFGKAHLGYWKSIPFYRFMIKNLL